MSDPLFKAFQSKTRRTADPALIDRWAFDASYHGDRYIKHQAAHAKRTATALTKACTEFWNLLPEQELAFRAAAAGMIKLSKDLGQLALWAKDYFAFCQHAREQERTSALDAFADERWGKDEAAFKFERDLVAELRSTSGSLSFAKWMHAQGVFCQFELSSIHTPSWYVHGDDLSPRRGLAEVLTDARRGSSRSVFARHAHASFKDYEDYLAFRKGAAQTTSQLLKMGQLIELRGEQE